MPPRSLSTRTQNTPPRKRVLIVDDEPKFAETIAACIQSFGYDILIAQNGSDALELARAHNPDLILTDVNMPGMNGLDLCRALRADERFLETPIIMITAAASEKEIAEGFQAGADDYVTKPIRLLELTARVRSMLRIRDARQALQQANDHLNNLNADLENRVRSQVEELQRVNRLRRFFSPQIVDAVLADSSRDRLQGHRGEVTVVFLDLRRFSPFAERHPPETVIHTIRRFHQTVGPVIFEHRGTLERFTGDGLMVFLGDPEPLPDHPARAVQLCRDIRTRTEPLIAEWRDQGFDLALGMGVATGIASLGLIGFEERLDYAAIGVVTNLAARICALAGDGEILLAESTRARLEPEMEVQPLGLVELKGFSEPKKLY
ncbi:MAG: response regulator, partial [Kiritimatiellae bacterium]|nr:response regulator [Kiritimatiellia bacterium]